MYVAAAEVAAWFAVEQDGHPCPNVHRIMAAGGERVTLASQQMRAHNLAWALHDQGLLHGQRIGVVGGGLAGLTFAVICAQLRGSVVLYEQAGRLLPTQWKSYDRYLHPNLFHWPQATWSKNRTDHPVLGWSDNFAAAVRDSVLEQVPVDRDLALDIRLAAFVTAIEAKSDQPTIHATVVDDDQLDLTDQCFDQVVVAAGFPMERPVPGAFGGSYWRTQCDAASFPPNRDIGIVGNGDGALTELMSLSLPGFRQDRLRDFVQSLCDVSNDDVLADNTPKDLHKHLSEHLAGASELVPSLGSVVDGLNIQVTSKKSKLQASSFVVNRCAAVAIELAQQRRHRPAIFQEPLR